MSENPLLEIMKKYMRELRYDLLDMSVRSIRSEMAHAYYIWKTLRRELGHDKGYEVYEGIVAGLTSIILPGTVASLGIRKVKDIPTLGRIVERFMTTFPCLYETVKNTRDVHIGHLPWCLNPTYGPSDNILERHDYFRQEVAVTIAFLRMALKYAQENLGLEEDAEVDVPQGRCRDGKASFCEYVIRRKGTPEVRPTILPDSENHFLEFEMGDEEPLAYVLKKQGRTLEEQGPLNFLAYFMYDIVAHDVFEAKLGKKRGVELYKKLWLNYPAEWTKEARLELEIGRPANLEDLAKIITFCEKKKFICYQMMPNGDNQITLVAGSDPFVELSTGFAGKAVGGDYLGAMVFADQELINQIVREATMGDMAKATVTKALAKGDDNNEILIERS